jgi:hypothetical protein
MAGVFAVAYDPVRNSRGGPFAATPRRLARIEVILRWGH